MLKMSRSLPSTLVALFAALPLAAEAQQVRFDTGWKEQRFSMFSSNDYSLQGNTLAVRSDGTVSLMWARLPDSRWSSTSASWNWSVAQSVPATDLTKKGGDDRNLAIYFVFLPESVARTARNDGLRALLDNPDARVLVYVWGGNHPQGRILPSPYLGPRGRTVAQRPAGTGQTSETVNLARDYQTAFGAAPEALVGLAVSADSDDTDSRVSAQISDLRVE